MEAEVLRRTFKQSPGYTEEIEHATLSIHELQSLLKCEAPFPVGSLRAILGEHIFEHLGPESAFRVEGIRITAVLAAMNILRIYPEKWVRNPGRGGGVGKAGVNDERSDE